MRALAPDEQAAHDGRGCGVISILRGNALALPVADRCVDLIVTSPPYFGLRSYTDAGEHYAGQIGDELTPAEFVDNLIAATREMARVLKQSGSIFVNLGDKYAGGRSGPQGKSGQRSDRAQAVTYGKNVRDIKTDIPSKSLMGIPWRYALRCIDDLGLILRAEIIWSKPNGLPESVTDRVRRSHETWFHFTKAPRYFSAVDEVREEHVDGTRGMTWEQRKAFGSFTDLPAIYARSSDVVGRDNAKVGHVLGKLPGSVWTIPTEPLIVPDHLGVDHFAAFPTEWPRRIISGWSPRDVCTACGEGRRPVVASARCVDGIPRQDLGARKVGGYQTEPSGIGNWRVTTERALTGYACACPDTSAPTTPGVVLDPFGGTGTTALVAHALGRHGISVEMSADYCRLAQWRTTDPKQRAKAARREYAPPPEQTLGQLELIEVTA